MNSHLYAEKLKETAEFLLSRPEFETSSNPRIYQYFLSKENFLAAVRALGAGEKKYDSTDLNFFPAGSPLVQLAINRSSVCRLVQEAKWKCEPILSAEEDASVGAEQCK